MNERAALPPLDATEASALVTRLQALATVKAASRAPLDWHFVSVLAQRAQVESGAVRARLTERLQQRIEDLYARLETSCEASDIQAPVAAASPLADLLHAMGTAPVAPVHAPEGSSARTAASLLTPAPRPELKSVGRMRKTLSRLKVRQQVSQALAQPPQHAGPINSQMLVLRSLALMQDISPEYLHRFMSHVDALMTLEDGQRLPTPAQAPAKTGKASGKVAVKNVQR